MSQLQPIALPSHEDLSNLARNDPVAYEALRREIIESFIASAPATLKPRLLGIQFRVDSLRRLSRSALGSTVKVYDLMWKSFVTLNNSLQDLGHVEDDLATGPGSTKTNGTLRGASAQIIQLRPRC